MLRSAAKISGGGAAANSSRGPRSADATVSGTTSEVGDTPTRWLNFFSENLYTCHRVGQRSAEFQTVARSRNLDGFSIARFKTSGRGASQLDRTKDDIRADCQDRVGVFLSLDGVLEMSQFGRRQVYGGNGLALLAASEPAVHTKIEGRDTICFMMPRAFVDQRVVDVEGICARPNLDDDPMAKLVRDTLISFQESALRMEDKQFHNAADLVGELVLLALAGASDVTTGVRSVRSSNLIRAKRIIRDRLGDLDLTIADIAAECGFSVSYLHNLFRDDGRTVREYLTGERLRRAREMLNARDGVRITVTDVSLACGYSNMSHFSTAFKRAFGMSPRDVMRGM